MKFIGIIPARYASTRFPGKPLADIKGKPMVQRVYEQASKVLPVVYVATDDERIYNAVKSFGGNAVMTSAEHSSGTDRCSEAVKKAEQEREEVYDVVVNIQGDEPFIAPEMLLKVMSCFNDAKTDIATLVKPFSADEDIFNPNSPKVVVGATNFALYFSRSAIPYLRGVDQQEWQQKHTFLKHIGLYGYRTKVLHQLTQLPQGNMEVAESLEQLRWLENGYSIKVERTEHQSIGIDTPEDLAKALEQNLL
ncbi:3-deoxy-manno-octulosonate cytidylyltransferase [Alistipes sp. ZOR0009]|uniref:3-deoxy-manno-octulosonate cytidylyltransferase n=1 Tax=Alistipes sp. ZOR0009 TaxID=1339253 RepID=UPI0006488443|nr:3-deoxy-manno-octulosonate cytidylyltransferase [Alistipes sp. ZOR0009]